MMDHSEATRLQAAERYLRGELSLGEAEAFEEHFFSCATCAEAVTLENAFAQNVQAVFRAKAHSGAEGLETARASKPGWWRMQTGWGFGSLVPIAATACLLMFVTFQNVSTIPRLRTEVSQFTSGEAPLAFPLTLARGNEAINVPKQAFFFTPYFFPPGSAAFARFTCDIETASGVVKKHVTVSAPQASQPVRLLLLRSEFPSGTYRVIVRGENAPDPIATYTMDLHTN